MSGDDPLCSLRDSEPVDARFADRLETSLRIQHAARSPMPAGRSPWRRMLLVVPGLVLVVVASAVLVLRDDAPSAALELREAHNVLVTLADGTSLVDPTGLELTEGSVVAVGPGGRAVIGDVELGAGSRVTVRGGELVTADPATTTSGPEPPTRPSASTTALTPTTTVGAEATRDDTEPAPSGDRADEPDPTRPPDPTPSRDRPPIADDGLLPVDPPRTTVPRVEGKGADIDEQPDRVVDLALNVRLTDDGVAIAWRASGVGLADVRVVLLRSAGVDPPEPDWPPDAPVVAVAETTGPEPGLHVDDVPATGLVARYRAVALVGDDVVARSAVQTLVPAR